MKFLGTSMVEMNTFTFILVCWNYAHRYPSGRVAATIAKWTGGSQIVIMDDKPRSTVRISSDNKQNFRVFAGSEPTLIKRIERIVKFSLNR